jgi:tellurite resistance protein TerC
MRGIMISLGAALVSEYQWILYGFGAFLVFTGVKMLRGSEDDGNLDDNAILKFVRKHFRVTQEIKGHNFTERLPHPETGKPVLWLTPLAVTLILVEFVDLIFAVDSVPAIFAVTLDPFIFYTSNIFAILGLRSLYFALAAAMHRFAYLKYAMAVILVLVGMKIFLVPLGFKVPTALSLVVTLGLLGSGVLYSLYKTRDEKAA